MRIYKAATLWSTIVGVVLGIAGLPVPVPATGWWTWFVPIGFRTASILALGTLGFLCGLFIDLLRLRKQTSRSPLPEWMLWLNGLAIVALLVSVVQIYRLAASDAEENWGTVSSCLAVTDAASQELKRNPSKANLESLSSQMRVAAAELWIVSRYYSRDRHQDLNLELVASGFFQAGSMLASSNPSDVAEAKQFIEHAGTIFRTIETRENGVYNQQTAEKILAAIASSESSTYKQYSGGF